MKVVLFDAMNLIHRARSGFTKGEHALVYNFYRSFKALVEKLEPDRAYFVLEGRPKHRSQVFEDYKANRPKQPDSFWRQQKEILQIMTKLPVVQLRHPDYECDDVLANLAKHYSDLGDSVVIVSGDSDFIQVFDTMDSELVRIYHPIKKMFLKKPPYTYLDRKALRGDVSDNIPGIKGIGDKSATKIMEDDSLMEKTMSCPEKKEIFERNKSLISFHWFDDTSDDLQSEGSEVLYPSVSIESVISEFGKMGFKSMISESYQSKFKEVFSKVHSHANE